MRNNTTVDPGGGGSSAKAVTSASTSKSANTAVKQSRDAAIREANPEEWARSEEARKNAARRATKLTNRERILLDNPELAAQLRYMEYYRDIPSVRNNPFIRWENGACTSHFSKSDAAHGGRSEKFGLTWFEKLWEDICNFNLKNEDENVVKESW